MEHHSGDFQVVVRDIRQWSQQENDALTLIWLLEGSVELRDGETGRYLQADELAIVNRHRRWSLNSKTANVVMTLSLNAGWLTRLDGDFFSSAYQSSSETRDAEDTLRYLMRQLLVLGLVNPQAHYRLEANRWLSEIALLLASRFSRPLTAQAPRGSERWSQRINRVVARIDANYQRRLSLQEIAAAEFVSEAWLSRLFRKEVGVSFMQYITGLRLRKAAEQLTATRRSVQQIAQQHGFASSIRRRRSNPLVRALSKPSCGSLYQSTGFTPGSMRRKPTAWTARRCGSIPSKPAISMCVNCRRGPRRCATPAWSLPFVNWTICCARMSAASWNSCTAHCRYSPSIFTIRFSAAVCSAPAGTIRKWPATPAGIICSAYLAGWRLWTGR